MFIKLFIYYEVIIRCHRNPHFILLPKLEAISINPLIFFGCFQCSYIILQWVIIWRIVQFSYPHFTRKAYPKHFCFTVAEHWKLKKPWKLGYIEKLGSVILQNSVNYHYLKKFTCSAHVPWKFICHLTIKIPFTISFLFEMCHFSCFI